jgi:HAE1 family hydrophobic/amphiphilic exporter-1
MSLGDVTNTMQILLGSAYVNDFDFNSRSYRVYVQADQQFRSNPGDIERYQVRTAGGRMMPLSDIVSVREATAPKSINHYNLFRSAEINGSSAPGYSSGQALQLMEQLSQRALPQGMSFSWSGLSLEEIKAGSLAIFGLGLPLVLHAGGSHGVSRCRLVIPLSSRRNHGALLSVGPRPGS